MVWPSSWHEREVLDSRRSGRITGPAQVVQVAGVVALEHPPRSIGTHRGGIHANRNR
jgi:hypothetical protein